MVGTRKRRPLGAASPCYWIAAALGLLLSRALSSATAKLRVPATWLICKRPLCARSPCPSSDLRMPWITAVTSGDSPIPCYWLKAENLRGLGTESPRRAHDCMPPERQSDESVWAFVPGQSHVRGDFSFGLPPSGGKDCFKPRKRGTPNGLLLVVGACAIALGFVLDRVTQLDIITSLTDLNSMLRWVLFSG
jgi:hypothetical protein